MNYVDQSVDLCTYHYADRLEYLIDNDRFEDADSIFHEFVVDDVDPNDGKYEWIFIDDLTQND